MFKFGVRARARGKLSKIRLRARAPNAEAAARTVRLRVRRQAGPSKTVIVRSFEFRPQNVTVRRGERLIWKGEQGSRHRVTFPGTDSPFGWGEFDEGIPRGERIARTAMRRGTFQYYCRPHGSVGRGMHGTVTVR